MKTKFTFLSSFWIKIFAFLFMTFDHIGYAYEMFLGGSTFSTVFRILGRLALPLFAYMIAEGAIHTKNMPKYLLRLGIMGTVISIAFLGLEYLPLFNGMSMWGAGNIFVDLTLGALAIYCLKNKNWYIKLLSILPVAIAILSFVANTLEASGDVGKIYWYPFFLRCQYDWYSVVMIVGFYACYLLSDVILKAQQKVTGLNYEVAKGSEIDRMLTNLLQMGVIVILTILLYLFATYWMEPKYVYWMGGRQNWAILSGAFILLYNGQRGYNRKWFQYGGYLYYPVHMVTIFLIFYLYTFGG